MKPFLIRSLFFVFLLAGCGSSVNVSEHYSFPGDTWKRFDNPIIETGINHPGIKYIMYLELEYDPSLAPAQLPVTVIMSTPSGEIRSRDITFKTDPAQSKVRLPLRKDFAFSEKGTCSFEIENRSQYVETSGMKRISVIMEVEE